MLPTETQGTDANTGLELFVNFEICYGVIIKIEGSGCFFHDKMNAPVLLTGNWLLPQR